MNSSIRRLVAGILLPAAALITVVILALAMRSSLPDPMATHWTLAGEPDDSTARGAFLVALSVAVAVIGLLIYIVSRRRSGRGDVVAPIAVGTFVQWLLVFVMAMSANANANASTWQDADELPLVVALIAPALGAVVAGVATAIALPLKSTSPTASGPTVGARPTERLVWLAYVRARWAQLLGAMLVAAGAVTLLSADQIVGAALVLGGITFTTLAKIAVTIDHRGVTVRYGVFGWPKTAIALDRIERADVRTISRGTWGYRGGLRLFGRAAVVVQSGDAIRLHLRDGRQFSISVPGAESAAGTINDLLGHHR